MRCRMSRAETFRPASGGPKREKRKSKEKKRIKEKRKGKKEKN